MLATLVDKPFDNDGWLDEVKWDGYRCIAFLNHGKVSLHSRNEKSFDEKFYPIHKALEELKINAVLDGEIVVVNEDGISNFGDLPLEKIDEDFLRSLDTGSRIFKFKKDAKIIFYIQLFLQSKPIRLS